jgi:predicted negative regulator of RcsB-dependent stress response
MQIKDFFQSNKKVIIFAVFIFLIVTISFGLGYLTALKLAKPAPIIIEKCSD